MTTMSLLAKSAYVGAARGARTVAGRTGLTGYLDRRTDSRAGHWVRSLLAIHDLDGLIALDVPWWTYDAIDAVAAFLARRPNARVFEYGSGASTLWLARRAGSVVSVEHHAAWADAVRERTSRLGNVSLRHVPTTPAADAGAYASGKPGHAGLTFEAYARSVEAEAPGIDLVVIDGRARPACLNHAVRRLAPNGLIVFDNSNRRRYREAISAAPVRADFRAGLAPSLPYRDETALLSLAPDA